MTDQSILNLKLRSIEQMHDRYDDLDTQNEDNKRIIERLSGVKYSDFNFEDQGAVVIQGGGGGSSNAAKPV